MLVLSTTSSRPMRALHLLQVHAHTTEGIGQLGNRSVSALTASQTHCFKASEML
jgi:hypothetical protein